MMSTNAPSPAEEKQSFAETALQLGGKSEEEARRTGAIDRADDQVEALFAPQYQTTASPAHRAVWDNHVPIELFTSHTPPVSEDLQRVMNNSLEVVRRHRNANTLYDAQRKLSNELLNDLGTAGYWGLLVDKQYGGSGAPFASISAARSPTTGRSATWCSNAPATR